MHYEAVWEPVLSALTSQNYPFSRSVYRACESPQTIATMTSLGMRLLAYFVVRQLKPTSLSEVRIF